jgi:glycosyltransferase involved in cell wall biosynthesis
LEQKKLLCWGDAPVACTGFGTVSKYIISALQATGEYEIDQLAINYHGQFVDRTRIPWQMSPARLLDPNDPYGNKMFLRAITDKHYDYIWILNDTFVVHSVAKEMRKILDEKAKTTGKKTVVLYYFPVDCRVISEASDMLRYCDVAIAYNEHGKAETLKVLPELADKLNIIYHGTDTALFRPFSRDIIGKLKQKYFGIDPETYLVINVNRNSVRKQISRTMYAFKEFKKLVPNSLLYLHTAAQDRDIDLISAAKHLELRPKQDIVFPPNYSPANGYPESILNELYNCGDVFVTNHLGEGWGLSVTEAMAAGTPVVAPRNTSMPEILGENSERGFMYDCDDLIFVDNSGYRPMASTDTIVNEMMRVYRLGWKHDLSKVVAARKWVEENNWANVCSQWLSLFSSINTALPVDNQPTYVGELL